MVTLFGFLLFWFGFAVTIGGTVVVAIKIPRREAAVVGVITCFMMSGTVFMGSAGVSFSYAPPPLASWPVAIILWIDLAGSIVIAATKPSLTKDSQEGHSVPPK